MQETFDLEHENLHWTALVITGDPTLAEKSIVDASGLQKSSSSVFRDWLTQWAHSATARAAAGNIHEIISVSAKSYSNWNCEHSDHELLSADQIVFVRRLEAQQIIESLDPLARSMLVLRGVQHASLSDCSLLLGVQRRSVMGAYCHALSWLREYTQSGCGTGVPITATSLDFNNVQK
ncbi:MAG TPA: hypothetical protein VN622_01755 [Clostridia bacterium]|nr:hypothetical protein [Clostridia bacterium]